MTQALTMLHGSGRLQADPKNCVSHDGGNVACQECFCAKTFLAQLQALYPKDRIILMRELECNPGGGSRMECAILIPELRIIAKGSTPQEALKVLIKQASRQD